MNNANQWITSIALYFVNLLSAVHHYSKYMYMYNMYIICIYLGPMLLCVFVISSY